MFFFFFRKLQGLNSIGDGKLNPIIGVYIPILRNPTEGVIDQPVFVGFRPRYDNVIAVELMNEPPLGGLPNCCVCMGIWRSILSFQVSVFSVLVSVGMG